MRPASTSRAPSQSTNRIAPNTAVMSSVIITARMRTRRMPVPKAASTMAVNRAASRDSWV